MNFEEEIKEKLSPLSDKTKILFGALTCEKLYPHYIAFEEKYGWGDSMLLANAISLTYEHIINRNVISISDIKNMLLKITIITPDMDDFESALASFALNAATSIYSMLKYLLDKNIDHITEIVSYTLDTVDMFIQEKEDMNPLDPSRDVQINNDNFMLKEQQRQISLVKKLSNMDLNVITDDLIEELRDNRPIIDLSLLW